MLSLQESHMPGKKDLQNISNSQEKRGLGEQKPTGMDLWSFTAVTLTSEGNTTNLKALPSSHYSGIPLVTDKLINHNMHFIQCLLPSIPEHMYKHTLEIWCIIGVLSKPNSKPSTTPQLASQTLSYLLLN